MVCWEVARLDINVVIRLWQLAIRQRQTADCARVSRPTVRRRLRCGLRLSASHWRIVARYGPSAVPSVVSVGEAGEAPGALSAGAYGDRGRGGESTRPPQVSSSLRN